MQAHAIASAQALIGLQSLIELSPRITFDGESLRIGDSRRQWIFTKNSTRHVTEGIETDLHDACGSVECCVDEITIWARHNPWRLFSLRREGAFYCVESDPGGPYWVTRGLIIGNRYDACVAAIRAAAAAWELPVKV